MNNKKNMAEKNEAPDFDRIDSLESMKPPNPSDIHAMYVMTEQFEKCTSRGKGTTTLIRVVLCTLAYVVVRAVFSEIKIFKNSIVKISAETAVFLVLVGVLSAFL